MFQHTLKQIYLQGLIFAAFAEILCKDKCQQKKKNSKIKTTKILTPVNIIKMATDTVTI